MKNIAFAALAALAVVAASLTTGCAAAPADDGTAAASDSNALSNEGGGEDPTWDCPSENQCHCRGTLNCNYMLNHICKAYPYCDIEEGQIDCVCWTHAPLTAAPTGARANASSKIGSAF